MIGRWRQLVIVAAVAVAAGSCATPSNRAWLTNEVTPEQAQPAPLPPAPVQAPVTLVRPPPGPTLSQPIDIPENSYAPEPVVQIGTMEIPKLRLNHPIFQGVTLNNIDLGPSHWPGSAVPGQIGNTVFAGHRVTNSSPFRIIDDLEVGDEVSFTVHGVRSVYRVTANMVVDDADSWIGDQTPTPTGTLYACHPPGSVEKRFVVRLALDPTVTPAA